MFEKAFIITKKNFILTSQFVFIVLVMSMLGGLISYKLKVNLILSLISLTSLLLLALAMFSGWFNMVKCAIENYDAEESKDDPETINLMSKFFPGIGQYFSKNIVITALYTFLFLLISFFLVKILIYFEPRLTMPFTKIMLITKSLNTLKNLEPSLEFKIFIFWAFILNFMSWFFQYLMTFSFAGVVFQKAEDDSKKGFFNSQNPIIIFINSLRFVTKKFANVFVIFLFLTAVSIAISVVTALSTVNDILYVIGLFLLGFYMTYYVTLVFLYYYENNKSNSDNGPDSDGQEPAGN